MVPQESCFPYVAAWDFFKQNRFAKGAFQLRSGQKERAKRLATCSESDIPGARWKAAFGSAANVKVIAMASPKGGSGKTTIASALAVRAAEESKRVAMFDLNSDQGNLTQWWVLRGEPMCPRLVEDAPTSPAT
jgi:Mrp family chromosome partitioning ATPase